MRRTPFSSQRDARRRPAGGEQPRPGAAAASSAPPCTAATVAAWTRTCLVDTTAHLLTAQPADPLRALGLRFTTEALLLATYPGTPAACAEDEVAEETAREVSRGISSAVPLPLAPAKPPTSGGGGGGGGGAAPPPGKSKSSAYRPTHAAAAPAADHLVAQAWVRRRLQPYGLHAVARCVCPCPALRSDAPPLSQPLHPHTLHAQWLDIFALLHRQSRMTAAELAAASAAVATQAGAAATTPPLDFRASYEVPAALVVLYAMALVEEHLRRGDLGAAQGPPSCRRLQLAVKLLALRLLAGCVEAQDQASEAASSCSSGSGNDAVRCAAAAAKLSRVTSGSGSLSVADALQRLSAEELEVLHRWWQGQLREDVILAPSPLTVRATAARRPPPQANACDPNAGDTRRETSDAGAEAPLAALQAHVRMCLTRVLHGSAGGEAAADAPVMVSLDVFVCFMERLAAVVVAHQHTVIAMALLVAARLPRAPPTTPATDGGREGGVPAWVVARVRACAAALAAPTTGRSRPAQLPPAWAACVRQLGDVLAPFLRDAAAEGDGGPDGEGRAAMEGRLQAWAVPVLPCRGAAGAAPRVAVVELLGHWVTHSVEVLITGLYPL